MDGNNLKLILPKQFQKFLFFEFKKIITIPTRSPKMALDGVDRFFESFTC